MEQEQQDTQPDLSALGHPIHKRFVALEQYERITTQAQRYELWAENLGLYHLGHSSLNYRFRDAPSICKLTSRLLSHLTETLSTGRLKRMVIHYQLISRSVVEEMASSGKLGPPMSVVSLIGIADAIPTDAGNEIEGSEEDLDSDEEAMLASYGDDSLIDIILARLEDIIDRLYRLSFRIRNPATRLNVSKAAEYRDVDESTNVDLMDVYAEADRKHVHELHNRKSACCCSFVSYYNVQIEYSVTSG